MTTKLEAHCNNFVPLSNNGDYVGTYCCNCGENEPSHNVERLPLEWADLWAAMYAEPSEWIATTESMYWEMLGVVPPAAQSGIGFLVGEPLRHNSDGDAVHACFKQVGDKFYARNLTHAQFKALA